jgi:hypothetical protein
MEAAGARGSTGLRRAELSQDCVKHRKRGAAFTVH